MRRTLLIILALLIPALAWAVACPTGYGNYYIITPDATKAGASDSTNFPMLVCYNSSGVCTQSLPGLKTLPNGGLVNNTSTDSALGITVPDDVVFCTGPGTGTQIPYDIASYNGTTGEFIAFVLQSTLSHTSGVPFYMLVGNSSVTTQQSDKTGTYPAFTAIWHGYYGIPACSPSAINAPGNNLCSNVNNTTSTTGKFGSYAQYRTSSSTGTTLTSSGSTATLDISKTDSLSICYWANINETSGAQTAIIDKSGPGNYYPGYFVGYNLTGGPNKTGVFLANNASSSQLKKIAGPAVFDNTPHRTCITYDGSVTVAGINIYVDGTLGTVDTSSNTLTGDITNTGFYQVTGNPSPAWSMRNTWIQEMWHAKGVVMSADWITADYNNQNSPSTFSAITGPFSISSGYVKHKIVRH